MGIVPLELFASLIDPSERLSLPGKETASNESCSLKKKWRNMVEVNTIHFHHVSPIFFLRFILWCMGIPPSFSAIFSK